MLSPQQNSVQLFKSCASARMIRPIRIMLCDLLEWWFLKIVQPSLMSSSSCHSKKRKPTMFWTEPLATDPFSSPFMNCLIWLYYWFLRGFYPKSLQPEENLISPQEPVWRASPVESTWRLRFIGGFKFICSARSMGNVFVIQIWIIYINTVACKICQ